MPKNKAKVQNCPDITIWNSVFGPGHEFVFGLGLGHGLNWNYVTN